MSNIVRPSASAPSNLLEYAYGQGSFGVLLFIAGGLLPGVASAADWEWSITPYAWLIGTEFTTAIDIPEDGEQSFSDIGSKLDFAGQVHIEARRDRFGVFADLTNLQLSSRNRQDNYQLKTDSSTTLAELGLTYTLGDGGSSNAMFFVGMRTLDVDFDLLVLPREGGTPRAQASINETLTDGMFGFRYQAYLNEDWSLVGRGDVASGDTDFSWNLSVLAARDFSKRGRLLIGYRYLDVEFKRGDELLDPKLVVSGPTLGYQFRF